MLKLGLTGGMGTGKATVAEMFRCLGSFVIDADEIARDAIRPGTRAHGDVVKAFGKGIVGRGGEIDRLALAGIVFRDREKLAVLNSIVHPPVLKEMRRLLSGVEREGKYMVAVANVPLLFEAGMQGEFDATVVVTCPREEQVRRCAERNGLSREEIEDRLSAQMPLEKKAGLSDYVIANGGTREDTERQVGILWAKLTGGR